MQFFSLFAVGYVVLATHIQRLRAWYLFLGVVLFCTACWYFVYAPPVNFPKNTTQVVIASGSSLSESAKALKAQHVIHSPELFILLTKLFSDERGVQAGTYLFSKPYDTGEIVYKVTHGVSDNVLIQVTFTEGSTVREMAETLQEKLPAFDAQTFLTEAVPYEGYLFPDTYRFMPTITTEEVITILQKTFTQKTAENASTINQSGHSFSDTIIMASILEREARTPEEKRIIAGILWKRIQNGMPLQVDAVFGYIKNRDTYSPSFEDLEIDSPYNTYRNKGLPPGPISNPGMESIIAAAAPITTDYVYYLTGKDGAMHYAKTFEEHKLNRAKYLD